MKLDDAGQHRLGTRFGGLGTGRCPKRGESTGPNPTDRGKIGREAPSCGRPQWFATSDLEHGSQHRGLQDVRRDD